MDVTGRRAGIGEQQAISVEVDQGYNIQANWFWAFDPDGWHDQKFSSDQFVRCYRAYVIKSPNRPRTCLFCDLFQHEVRHDVGGLDGLGQGRVVPECVRKGVEEYKACIDTGPQIGAM
jgi:hypothetical protein